MFRRLAAAAAVTDTLRVGCRVFCVDYHVPAVLAKEAATIDLLRHAGVAIVPRADGLAITLDAKALADLRPRARLQFVDRWR